jgi:hypothetical protein
VEDNRETIRLTIRMPEALDNMLRAEAEKKGMPLNQIMLMMLNKEFYSDRSMVPHSFS